MPTASRKALSGPPEQVAPMLLGALLVSRLGGELVVVRISEVEAYGGAGDDPASHAFRGPTARNAAMFGPAGHAYVYFSYGMHWCMNVVTGPIGTGAAVLVRAGEVVEGVEAARRRRPAARRDRDLARGPARLCASLGVDGGADGLDLLAAGSGLHLQIAEPSPSVVRGPRVGISVAVATPWRFWLPGDATVSAYRPGGKPAAPR